MKNTITSIAVALCVVFGGIVASGVVAQQYYSQATYSPQSTSYSSTGAASQYTTYESVPVPQAVNYRSNRVLGRRIFPSRQRAAYSTTYRPTSSPVVYNNTTMPGYSSPATYSTTSNYSASPAYSSSVAYATPNLATYRTGNNNIVTPIQTYTSQSYPAQSYPAQSFASQSSSGQSYPSQTYATQASATQPSQTYASSSVAPVNQGNSQTYTSSRPMVYSQPVVNSQPASYSSQPASYSTGRGSVLPGLAQRKAVQASQMRLRGHLGGGLGGAKYEGVGWSNHSRQRAIESCCYWGARPTAEIGCAQGPDGVWYACVLYH